MVPVEIVEDAYYTSGAGYVIPKEIRDRTWEMQFRDKLQKAGLEAMKIDILVCHFVYDMSMVDSAKELGVLSASTTLRLMNEGLAYLRRVGFKK